MKRVLAKTIAFVMLAVMLVTGVNSERAQAAENYKSWAQSDSRWGSTKMGSGSATVKSVGCLLTAVTKLAIQAGLKDESCTPGVSAAGITNLGGFTSGGALYWQKAVDYFGFNYYSTLLSSGTFYASDYDSYLVEKVKSGYHIVLCVRSSSGSQHWVAIDEGRTLANGTVYIMDSLYNTSTNTGITFGSRYSYFTNAKGFVGGSTSYSTGDTNNSGSSNYATIENGDYIIKSVMDQGYGMDVCGAGTDYRTSVQMYPLNGTNAQTWTVTAVGNGYYTIAPKCASGMCLDVPNASSSSQSMWIWGANGSNAQRFRLVPCGSGYAIYPECGNGTVLDWQGGYAHVSAVITYNFHGGTNQQFIFEKVGSSNSGSNSGSSTGTTQTSAKYVVTPNAGLNVRSGAGTSYKRLGALSKGTVVEVVGFNSDGTWAHIKTSKYDGWVCATYLRAQ